MRNPQDPVLISVKNKVEKAQQPKKLKVNQFVKGTREETKNEEEKINKNLDKKYNKLLEENKNIKNQAKNLENKNKAFQSKHKFIIQ